MINFWKLAYKSVKEQRDQHKVELQQCKSERHHYKAELESYKTNLKQRKEALEFTRDEVKKYKAERDTLIDDIAVLKANISRLERQNAEQLALLKEFRKLIDYKLTLHQGSLMYREYRSKLDQLGVK